ncbi:uncharacterized protein LOC142348338 isoform X1 [Convolutriloba macropyga]|uniref:uncharacterized protein LOC142348338 isoform X1 n=1 Tax=Convolutriloba macropyga TaxID=536237 RepID=UPI003F52662F
MRFAMENNGNSGDGNNHFDDNDDVISSDGDDVISDNEDIVHAEESSDEEGDYDHDDVSSLAENDLDGNSSHIAGSKRVGDGDLDMSVYDLFRSIKLPWPCLSVDSFGSFDPVQSEAPFDLTFVGGSQATSDKENRIFLFNCRTFTKKSKLKIKFGAKNDSEEQKEKDDEQNDSSSSSSEDENSDHENGDDEDAVPKKKQKSDENNVKDSGSTLDLTDREKKKQAKQSGSAARRNTLHCLGLEHKGACNRVRQSKVDSDAYIVASWSSNAVVSLYNVTKTIRQLDPSISKYESLSEPTPVCYSGHSTEGYALDFSPVMSNRVASGDCSGQLHVWEIADQGSRVANVNKFKSSGNNVSIEDIQWSPAEKSVLCSCSTDSKLKIWDTRTLSRSMLCVDGAHGSSDVNVISWNPSGDPFIVSGGDDSHIKVWDLRQLSKSTSLQSAPTPVAKYDFHRGPITSLKWSPSDSTQFAASSEDNTISIWDLSLERDNISSNADAEEGDLPAQLLFLHEGQQSEIKEITWHPSVKHLILSTAADSLQLFMPNNL